MTPHDIRYQNVEKLPHPKYPGFLVVMALLALGATEHTDRMIPILRLHLTRTDTRVVPLALTILITSPANPGDANKLSVVLSTDETQIVNETSDMTACKEVPGKSPHPDEARLSMDPSQFGPTHILAPSPRPQELKNGLKTSSSQAQTTGCQSGALVAALEPDFHISALRPPPSFREHKTPSKETHPDHAADNPHRTCNVPPNRVGDRVESRADPRSSSPAVG